MEWLDSFEKEVKKILVEDRYEIFLPSGIRDVGNRVIHIWDRDGFLIKAYLITPTSWEKDLDTIRSVKKHILDKEI